MKKILLLLVFLFTSLIFAQVPQGISYQAIALNPSGYPVSNAPIGVRISILDNSITGNVVYTETHTTTTSDRGLYNLVIGQGSPVTGQFPLINWGTNSKFLKLELDATGGTNYLLVGTTQLWSVPYALYAEKANSVDAIDVIGGINYSSISGFMTNTKAYYLFNGLTNLPNHWIEYPITGNPIDIISEYSTLGILTSTNAYVCTIINNGQDTSNTYAQWFPIQLSGTPIKIINSSGSIGVLTSTHAYVFSYTVNSNNEVTYNWFTQPISGTPKDMYAFGRGFFGVVTSTNAYAFATTILISGTEVSASWYSSEPLSEDPIKIRPNFQTLSVYTPTHAYSFVPIFTTLGNTSFEWKSIEMSGTYIDSSK
jgi:hypothetical protein